MLCYVLQGNTIDVFGRRSLHRLPSTLYSFLLKAAVLGLLVQEKSSYDESQQEVSVSAGLTFQKYRHISLTG